ncbi:YdgA family protein [Enterobacteriaceae bacterium ESL0689]|nr:YdgA family protein [Enterobacteriaceae bacterium ESL0689]
MKKSLVAVGIIVALGIIEIGGACHSGKKIEASMPDIIKQVNTQIQKDAPDAGIELVVQNYQRELLSSHFQLIIQPIAGHAKNAVIDGEKLVLDGVIDHGPFPLGSLKSGNLIPAAASVKTTLANNDTNKKLFAIANGESPIVTNTRIAYGGNSKTVIDLKPLNYAENNTKITFNGGKFDVNVDHHNKEINLSGYLDAAQLSTFNEYNQKIQLSFNKLKSEGSSLPSRFDMRSGTQNMTIDNLAISINDQQLAVLEEMEMSAKTALTNDGKAINSQMDYIANKLKIKDQDLGNGKLTIKLENLDGQAWSQFIQVYNEKVQSIMGQPGVAENPELYRQALINALSDTVPVLLKGSPSLAIAPLSWSNAKGESTFSLALALQDPSQNNSTGSQTLMDTANSAIKSIDGKLIIPVDMATAFMAQIATIQGVRPSDAEKQAKQQIDALAAMGQAFHITTMDNNAITSHLQYTNGQVTLNGNKISIDDFAEIFGFMEQ